MAYFRLPSPVITPGEFWTFLVLLPLQWVLYWTARLVQNYLTARRMSPGIPIIVIPFDHTNRFWSIIDKGCLAFLDRIIPFRLLKRTSLGRYNFRGFELFDRYYTHHELGNVYAMVSPSRIWLFVGDPDAAIQILKHGSDFPRCLELNRILDVFGPSVATVEGAKWKLQRKIMSACFGELTNEIVWAEAVSQGSDMVRYWATTTKLTTSTNVPSGVSTIAYDLRTLSIHVLSRAGFGKSSKFQGHDEMINEDGSADDTSGDSGVEDDSYRDALKTILDNCVPIIVLGRRLLSKPWLQRRLRGFKLEQIHQACVSFQGHMSRTYEAGKRRLSSSEGFQGALDGAKEKGFMASLVRASKEEGGDGGLTEAEIYGNIFLLNFAGHDTITHTTTFSVFFLAAYPQVQDWISEELRRVLGTREPQEWSYTSDFPRLKRCLAVMLETLRLYAPIPLAKWTDTKAAALQVGERRIMIPPRAMVIPSYSSLHTDPRYWGEDSLDWRPERWIEHKIGADGVEEEEVIKTPKHGSFIPWSEGVHHCPGKRFSQVEFVATMASLFRDWRVDPVCLRVKSKSGDGEGQRLESLDEARKRVLRQIETDSGPILLLQMLHPERAPLVWRKRP